MLMVYAASEHAWDGHMRFVQIGLRLDWRICILVIRHVEMALAHVDIRGSTSPNLRTTVVEGLLREGGSCLICRHI
jgi:hypothetical protein